MVRESETKMEACWTGRRDLVMAQKNARRAEFSVKHATELIRKQMLGCILVRITGLLN